MRESETVPLQQNLKPTKPSNKRRTCNGNLAKIEFLTIPALNFIIKCSINVIQPVENAKHQNEYVYCWLKAVSSAKLEASTRHSHTYNTNFGWRKLYSIWWRSVRPNSSQGVCKQVVKSQRSRLEETPNWRIVRRTSLDSARCLATVAPRCKFSLVKILCSAWFCLLEGARTTRSLFAGRAFAHATN